MKYMIFTVGIFCCLGAGYQVNNSQKKPQSSAPMNEASQQIVESTQPAQSWNHFPKDKRE